MIDGVRIATIGMLGKAMWWIARPSIGKKKFMQHLEIVAKIEIETVRKGDNALVSVKSGAIYVAGMEILKTPKTTIEEEIDRIYEDV